MEAKTKKKRVIKKSVKRGSTSGGKSSTLTPTPHLRLYRRIAVTFFTATCLTLLAVMYLSFSRVTIHVSAAAQPIDVSFFVDVLAGSLDNTALEGKIVSSVFEQAQAQEVVGERVKNVEAKSVGTVTLYNTTSKDQPLVATTRLVTPEQVLFRLDEAVIVPAGGTVQVQVHADQPGVHGDVAPTSFTIPGLNPSLQPLIYAKSTESFTGGLTSVKVVTAEDLEAAGKALEMQMLEAAKETLRLEAGAGQTGEVFYQEILEKKTDTPVGTETPSVMVSLKMRVVGVFFSHETLMQLVQAKTYEQVPQGIDLDVLNDTTVMLTMDRYDLERQMATLQVAIHATGKLSSTSPLLHKENFLGRSATEVKNNLEASDAVDSVELRFTPFWLKRIPTLKDHIKIVIE